MICAVYLLHPVELQTCLKDVVGAATILFIISGAWAIRVLCLFSARNSRFVQFRTQLFYFTSVYYISFLLHGLIDAFHKSYLGAFGSEALQYVLLISSAVIRFKSASYRTFYSTILTRVCLKMAHFCPRCRGSNNSKGGVSIIQADADANHPGLSLF